ncbi:MAG: hypothetical protein K0R17_2234 [Rariglobus sp.]|jgi:hypothetical protein|nr:hypothetical protein [Rariglobus sp.]
MLATVTLADLVLCIPPDALSGWAPALQREVQPVPLCRAKNATQIDRGNVLVSYSFMVARGHTDYAAAMAYLDDLPRAVGRAFGNFTADRGLGSPITSLVNASAIFNAQPARGIRTWVQFTVTGSLPATLV